MREFFRGWRRKTGCLTLMMACVFMAGWMRSLNHEDAVKLEFGESPSGETHERWDHAEDRLEQMRESASVTVKSIGQSIVCYRTTDWGSNSKRPLLSWQSNSIPFGATEEFTTDFEWPNENRWQFCGLDFGFVKGRITVNYGCTTVVYKIPYAFFVLPLTVVSFWLLLSKPRQLIPRKTTEPTSHDGA